MRPTPGRNINAQPFTPSSTQKKPTQAPAESHNQPAARSAEAETTTNALVAQFKKIEADFTAKLALFERRVDDVDTKTRDQADRTLQLEAENARLSSLLATERAQHKTTRATAIKDCDVLSKKNDEANQCATERFYQLIRLQDQLRASEEQRKTLTVRVRELSKHQDSDNPVTKVLEATERKLLECEAELAFLSRQPASNSNDSSLNSVSSGASTAIPGTPELHGSNLRNQARPSSAHSPQRLFATTLKGHIRYSNGRPIVLPTNHL